MASRYGSEAPDRGASFEPELDAAGVTPGVVVGSGPRGVTIRARRTSDGKEMAVKVGPVIAGWRGRRRFMAEADAIRGLPPSPYLVAVLDRGVSGRHRPWLVSPWMVGGALADRLGEGTPIRVGQVVDAARDAASGLVVLHREGLLHANLTPAGLLADGAGHVAVDGVALASLKPDWPAGVVPPHVPPEVLEGEEWTVAGDVWALGSCLYTLLAGRRPWATEATQGRIGFLLAVSDAPPPPAPRSDVPAWLSALIGRCLEPNPAARPRTAGEVVARLNEQRAPARLATLPPTPRPQPTGQPLGSNYLLIELIGRGSSGEVWRGERRVDAQPVAVKILRPELVDDAEAVARFLRERTTLVGLDHPNLVPILDLVAEGSTLAIVMEYVDGSDLRHILDLGDTGLPAAEALLLVAQVASALDAVHARGLVHRDLKPENVLIQQTPVGLPLARVTDFGIARAVGAPTVTRTTQLVGTAEYLAPELVAGRPLTPAADVYSLGVTTYEMLSGRRPFEGAHPAAVLRAHLDTDPELPAGLDARLWDFLVPMLAKDPGERPTARAVMEAAERLGPRLPGWSDMGAHPTSSPAERDASPPPAEPGRPYGSRPAPVVLDPDSPSAGTATSVSLRPLPVVEAPAVPARRGRLASRKSRLIAAAVLVLAAAGGGVAYGVTRHSNPPPLARADVTSAVVLGRHGTATVRWSSALDQPGFYALVLTQQEPPATPHFIKAQPALTATSTIVTGLAPGRHCFEALALFRGPVPPALGKANPTQECVTVP